MKLETYKVLPINRSPIRLLKRDYLARMDFDLVGFPSGTAVKFRALLPDGQEYEDNDSSHFRILNNQLTYRIPRDLSESSGSLVSAFFSINGVESSRLLIHITEPNDIKSNNYIGQMDRIMNHVLSDAILINEISTNGSGIIDAKTDELIKQITDWTNNTLAKVNKTVSNSLTSIADVRAVIDKEIDVDRNNFINKMADVQSNIDKANASMKSLTKTLDATKAEVNKIDVVQMQNDAKSAKDAANAIESKMGNVPTGSTVMSEISKAQLVTGATVNGKDVAISNKKLQITLPNPDLSAYVKTSSLGVYAKTTDIDTRLKDYAKKVEIVTEGTIATKTPLYRSTNLWVQSKNNWEDPKDMHGGASLALDQAFRPSDLKHGIYVGINKHLITDNSAYPTVDMPSFSGIIISDDFVKFSEIDYYYFISKDTVEAASLVSNFTIVNQPIEGSNLRDRYGALAGMSNWSDNKGSLNLTFGKSNDGSIGSIFAQLWIPTVKYSNLTITAMSFPVIDEIIAV